MNVCFLGDAYDYWKGSLLNHLQRSGLLINLTIDAMATEPPSWQEEDWTLYASLLNVAHDRVLKHRELLSVQRANYFQEIPVEGDLFLDPDTGLVTGRVKKAERYVYPRELVRLVEGSRVVCVYQHSSRTHIRHRVEAVVNAVQSLCPTLSYVSYEATTVAMLFFSVAPNRILALNGALRGPLGRRADNRVFSSGRAST